MFRGSGLWTNLAIVLIVAMAAGQHPHPGPQPGDRPAPLHTVNLNLPPFERWAEIATVYKPLMKAPMKYLLEKLGKGSPIHGLATGLIAAAKKGSWTSERIVEMEGFAYYSNFSVEAIELANLFYELTPSHFNSEANPPLSQRMCTSIVAQLVNNSILHARNQDYGLPGLNNITFDVEFVKDGQKLYIGTTFASYIGMPTGMRYSDTDPWSVSSDSRFELSGLNYSASVDSAYRGGASVGFFVRDALETCASYSDAVQYWKTRPTIAPAYYIIGGTAEKQGCVISRNRDGPDNSHNDEGIWSLEDGTKAPAQWFRVETNWDHWEPNWMTDGRREHANNAMLALGPSRTNFRTLFELLSTPPVLATDTDYTTLAFPAVGEYRTILRGGYQP